MEFLRGLSADAVDFAEFFDGGVDNGADTTEMFQQSFGEDDGDAGEAFDDELLLFGRLCRPFFPTDGDRLCRISLLAAGDGDEQVAGFLW